MRSASAAWSLATAPLMTPTRARTNCASSSDSGAPACGRSQTPSNQMNNVCCLQRSVVHRLERGSPRHVDPLKLFFFCSLCKIYLSAVASRALPWCCQRAGARLEASKSRTRVHPLPPTQPVLCTGSSNATDRVARSRLAWPPLPPKTSAPALDQRPHPTSNQEHRRQLNTNQSKHMHARPPPGDPYYTVDRLTTGSAAAVSTPPDRRRTKRKCQCIMTTGCYNVLYYNVLLTAACSVQPQQPHHLPLPPTQGQGQVRAMGGRTARGHGPAAGKGKGSGTTAVNSAQTVPRVWGSEAPNTNTETTRQQKQRCRCMVAWGPAAGRLQCVSGTPITVECCTAHTDAEIPGGHTRPRTHGQGQWCACTHVPGKQCSHMFRHTHLKKCTPRP